MLNYEEIKKDPQRITKIKLFMNKYVWEWMHFTSEKDDYKKREENDVAIALNVLYLKAKNIFILLVFQNITQIMKKKLFVEWF